MTKIQELNGVLLANIKAKLPELEELENKITRCEQDIDHVYRFYHHSFKVYYLQNFTKMIVDLLNSLAPPEIKFNDLFLEILKDGTGKEFEMSHNREWAKHTRPILEAYFHAKQFLTVAIKNGKELEVAPEMLPSSWALLLYYYNLR